MNTPTKANKIVAVIIVFGALATYIAIIFLIDSVPGSAGLSQWLNNQRIMTENKKDLLEKIQGNPQFKDIEINPYISEVQGLVKMQEKRNLSSWISFRTFAPNLSGIHINTNDFGLRSKLNLAKMVQKARTNKNDGIKNVLLLGGSTAFGYGALDDNSSISGYLNSSLDSEGFEIFNLAQGGYTSFMELFILSTIGIYMEPDVIIIMDGYADAYHLAYSSDQPDLSFGQWTGKPEVKDPAFVLNFYYQNLEAICKLAGTSNHQVIIATQPVSGFENNSRVELEKIKDFWKIYPSVRETARMAAEMNNADFIDLTTLFKSETDSQSYFFDKSHLNSLGQKKVAKALMPAIKFPSRKPDGKTGITIVERNSLIQKVINKDYQGEYKTAQDY
jgi:lysophospholipase L1-like esterase